MLRMWTASCPFCGRGDHHDAQKSVIPDYLILILTTKQIENCSIRHCIASTFSSAHDYDGDDDIVTINTKSVRTVALPRPLHLNIIQHLKRFKTSNMQDVLVGGGCNVVS